MSMQPTRPNDPNDPRTHQSKRTFSELDPKRKGLRDTDITGRGVLVYAMMAAGAGFIMGGALGIFLMRKWGAPGWVALLCPRIGNPTARTDRKAR